MLKFNVKRFSKNVLTTGQSWVRGDTGQSELCDWEQKASVSLEQQTRDATLSGATRLDGATESYQYADGTFRDV